MSLRTDLTIAMCIAVFPLVRLASQDLPEPNFRIRGAHERAARVADSLARVDQAMRANHVHIDTARGGVTWVEYALPHRAPSAATPEAAAAGFLAAYGSRVLGIDAELGGLEPRGTDRDERLHHIRYDQRHAGFRVMRGQWIVHVAQVARGYVVHSANGWLFPEIATATVPALSRREAEQAAVSRLTRASPLLQQDTAPIIVAHDGLYRLAYVIPVLDDSRGLNVTRYVDAVNGAVFAESLEWPDGDHAPANARASRSRTVRASPTTRVTHDDERASLVGFVDASGTDALGSDRDFKAYQVSDSVFELRDNEHAGASEIQIRNFNGASLSDLCYVGGQSIVEQSDNDWPTSDAGKEEVSAVHNLGVSVSYFKNTFGRNGMKHSGGVLTACVHGTSTYFDSRFYGFINTDSGTLGFRQKTGADLPSVAAQDAATHEFTHGVAFKIGINPGNGALNEGLADYFGVRTRANERCRAKDVFLSDSLEQCIRYIALDSLAECEARNPPGNSGATDAHCQGIRLASALLNTAETSSGYFANETDWNVYGAMCSYMTSAMDIYAAAHAIVARARIQEHWGGLAGASAALETQFVNHGLQNYNPVTVQMTGTSEWTVTINNLYYVYDISFEVGSYGLNGDGSVAPPDSPIDVIVLREDHYYDAPIAFGQDETEYHSCGDGHAHSFKVTLHTDYGPLTYYAGQHGCGGSLMAGPATTDALPTKFAVRQAIQTSNGIASASIVGSGGQRGSLGAQVRQYGLTALEIDIPISTVPAPIEITVFNPQGRVVRRIVTAPVGPGTERVPWDRKNDRGEPAPPGVYVVLVHQGSNRYRTHFIIPADR